MLNPSINYTLFLITFLKLSFSHREIYDKEIRIQLSYIYLEY